MFSARNSTTASICLSFLLTVTLFETDARSNYPERFDTIRERVENRSYPSLFGAWGGFHGSPALDRHDLTPIQQMALYDVHWQGYYFASRIIETDNGYELESFIPLGHKSVAENKQRWVSHYNPNRIYLYALIIRGASERYMPEDSPFWLRDENGDRIPMGEGFYFNDITNKELQSLIIEDIVRAAESGFYDGVFFDSFRCCGWSPYITPEAEIEARSAIFEGIRDNVHNDFLIVVNTNRSRPHPNDVSYINGIFMETVWDNPPGFDGYPSESYTLTGLAQIEETLSWAADNLRQPTVNCLEGFGTAEQPFDSPDNLRLMRLFTTMSLVLDDSSVLYNKGLGHGHSHHWYDFWDADLGRPVGPKREHYLVNGRVRYSGLYIREFENGWAMYNRTNIAHEIVLPEITASVATGRYDYVHEIPKMDGDIFLRTHPTGVHRSDLLTTTWGAVKQ